MIVCEQKPIEQIKQMLSSFSDVAIIGCEGCVTVCMVGGQKEVSTLAQALKMAFAVEGKELKVQECIVKRQCEPEFLHPLSFEEEALLCCGCGVGVQALSERFPKKRVFPALDTKFMGTAIGAGAWALYCLGCGHCMLDKFFGVCPIARCAKGLMNGPCGGSMNGQCEVRENTCAWDMIIKRAKEAGEEEFLLSFFPPKDWSTSWHGGPQRFLHPETFLDESP
jgi:ferredoxin